MSRGYAFDPQKYYIVSQPTKLSDLQLDNLGDDDETIQAVKRGRKFRERREAHINNQFM